MSVTPCSVPGTIGVPTDDARRRAPVLEPMARMLIEEGPMKVRLLDSQASAKSAFSLRKP
jgi:hypothetical protein